MRNNLRGQSARQSDFAGCSPIGTPAAHSHYAFDQLSGRTRHTSEGRSSRGNKDKPVGSGPFRAGIRQLILLRPIHGLAILSFTAPIPKAECQLAWANQSRN